MRRDSGCGRYAQRESGTGDLLTRVNPHTGLALKDDPAVAGIMLWIKDQPIRTADATFTLAVPKAAAALSSLDQQPLRQSRKILISTIAAWQSAPTKRPGPSR